MSKSFQSMSVTGYIARDPELSYTPSGKPVTKFSIPINHWNGKDDETWWLNIVAWGKDGETINKLARKGTLIALSGSFYPHVYTRKDGSQGVVYELTLREFSLQAGFNSTQQGETIGDVDDLGF